MESQQKTDELSLTSRRMLELQEPVLTEWEQRVRKNVRRARGLSSPILINTFPALYQYLAEALSSHSPSGSALTYTTVAAEHGGERARLTNYEPESVIQEYQELRWAILTVLKANGVALSENEFISINSSLDFAIRESVTAFSLIYAALREQFVAAVTHDLKTPLGAASMAAELIIHTPGSAETHELARKIIAHNNRMNRMLEDLLDAMVFQGGERNRLDLSPFDIYDVVREVVDQAAATHGPRFDITGCSVRGWWSRESLKRALENLVGNAVKYGASGTPVTVDIDEAHGRMILTVHNEGEPVPQEQMESIFQIFRRTLAAKESNTKGWGIGLPYVRTVAESHGGSVGVNSTKEHGTCFVIDVPVDARPFQNAPTISDA
jgi:signal transduction histidine kinase